MSKLKLTILLTTIVSALVFSGCAKKPVPIVNSNVNQNQNVNVNTNEATSTVATSTKASETTTETTTNNFAEDNDTDKIDTSDWKTYRNEEYGFEFKYPTNWGYATVKDIGTIGFGGALSGLQGEDSVLFEADILIFPSFNEKYFESEKKQNNVVEENLITNKGLNFVVLDGSVSGQEKETPLWRWRNYYFKQNNNYLHFSCLNQIYNSNKNEWSIKNSKNFCDILIKTIELNK